MTFASRVTDLVTVIAAAVNARSGRVGASAYDLAFINGYQGTQAQWLAAIPGVTKVASLAALNAAVPTAPVGQVFTLSYFVLDSTSGLRHRHSTWQVIDGATAGQVAVPIARVQLENGTNAFAATSGGHLITLAKGKFFSDAVAALPNLALYGQTTELMADGAVLRWNSAWQFVDSPFYPYAVAGANIGGSVGGRGYRWFGGRQHWIWNITITAAAGGGAIPSIPLPVAQSQNGALPIANVIVSVNGVRYRFDPDFSDANTMIFRYLTSNGNLAAVTTATPVGLNPGAIYVNATYDTY